MDLVDQAVWQEVCRLLEEPERLEQEYRRRLLPQQTPDELGNLEVQMGKLRRGIARLIDSYADALIDKQEFEPRVTRMRKRMQQLEEQAQHLKEAAEGEGELRLILGRLETFTSHVKAGLEQAHWQTRRDIIRALVKRVEVDEQQIRVVFRLSPTLTPSSSDHASHNWQHCGRRVHPRCLEGNMGTSLFFEPIAEL
jgi:site-specific DNA recombinase